jgi:hypothetical protein
VFDIYAGAASISPNRCGVHRALENFAATYSSFSGGAGLHARTGDESAPDVQYTMTPQRSLVIAKRKNSFAGLKNLNN